MPQAIPNERPGTSAEVLYVRMSSKLKNKLKLLAAKKDRTMQEIALEAVEQYLETQ